MVFCRMHERMEFEEEACPEAVRNLKYHQFCAGCGCPKTGTGQAVRYCDHAGVVLCASCEEVWHKVHGLAF